MPLCFFFRDEASIFLERSSWEKQRKNEVSTRHAKLLRIERIIVNALRNLK